MSENYLREGCCPVARAQDWKQLRFHCWLCHWLAAWLQTNVRRCTKHRARRKKINREAEYIHCLLWRYMRQLDRCLGKAMDHKRNKWSKISEQGYSDAYKAFWSSNSQIFTWYKKTFFESTYFFEKNIWKQPHSSGVYYFIKHHLHRKVRSLYKIFNPPPVQPTVQAGNMLPISEVFWNAAKQQREKRLWVNDSML